MTTASARLLVGRTIVGFELNPWTDEDGRRHHNPILRLDNGATVQFSVTEASGDYGVTPSYFPARS